MSDAKTPQVGHFVFFTLKESNEANRQALVDSCQEFLTGHPGVVHCSFGVRGEDFTRPVNDAEYDVSLHVIFESRAAHDEYQQAPRHLEFIAANQATWEKVRIFDSYI